MRSPGGVLALLDVQRPAGDMSRPAMADIVLMEDLLGGGRVRGDLGGGRFDITSGKGALAIAAPDFATTVINDASQQLRSLAFPLAHWRGVVEESSDGRSSLDASLVYGRVFESPAIRSALRDLWALNEDEGAPSRLLARAAGCEILAELCRMGGAPFAPANGGLAPWAERRCLELIHARYAEDISLDELAAEARLSTFHFARMFRRSVGVPPRAYLTRLRVQKACELLERTDLSMARIALEVGYASHHVLSRVFAQHMRTRPSDYRRAVRAPARGGDPTAPPD
jgi:AraC family transcriptional regulator